VPDRDKDRHEAGCTGRCHFQPYRNGRHLTSEKVPPQYIISIAEDNKVIWSRAESNLEPTTWTSAEASTSPTSGVRLVARDDAKPSHDDQMDDDTGTGQPDARSAQDDTTTDDRMQVDQPPTRVRRVYLAPKYAEPFTGECPLCLVEYVSGQVVCSTCGYEPLPVDESAEPKKQPNRRTRILEKRMQKLADFGMFGKVNSTLLATLTSEQADMLRQEMGSRGITSIESSVIKERRDRHKRAKQLGYEDVGQVLQRCDLLRSNA